MLNTTDMDDPKNEEAISQPVSAFVVFGANVGVLISYLYIIIHSNISDSVGAFLLFCHLLICIVLALKSKRPVWWVSACAVAFPLISLLTS